MGRNCRLCCYERSNNWEVCIFNWVTPTRRNIHPLTYHGHQPSFISFFYLPRSIASSLFSLRACQSFLHNLSPCPFWSASWSVAIHFILHNFFTQSVCFRNACYSHTIASCFAVVPRLYRLFPVSLSKVFIWNSIFYLNITHPSDHSHLCPPKCHLVFFPDRPGLTSVWHTTSHTTAVQPPDVAFKVWFDTSCSLPFSNLDLRNCAQCK